MNWRYGMPTKVIGGRGCIRNESALMSGLGKKALIVTGRRSAKDCGALDDLTTAFSGMDISWILFDQVEPNPSIATIRTAALIASDECVDFVVGIGGGSPLDAAKAIAVATVNEVDDTALFKGSWKNAPLPIVAIPTTSGTGSEVTPYAILTDNKVHSKRNLSSPSLFPRLAYLDPSYTDNLPRHVTIHTAVDALSHALEGLMSNRSTPMTDILAREALGILGTELRALDHHPGPESRDRLMYASMLAGMVIAHTGTTALHAMGYSLTYFKDIDHGRANGLLMPAYLAFVAETHPKQVQDALDAMGFSDLQALARTLSDLLGERETLSEQEKADFAAIASRALNLPNTLRLPSEADLAAIYNQMA